MTQTASIYSIKSRMNDKYIRSRACLRSLNFKALSRLSLGHAFSTMFLYMIWLCVGAVKSDT